MKLYEIHPQLFLSALFVDDDRRIQILERHGISVVLCTLAHVTDPVLAEAPGFTYYHWPVPDGHTVPIKRYEAGATLLLRHIHQGEKVLVHCYAGRNRSGLTAALTLRRLLG